MQPWRISAGLTAAVTGAAVLLGGERLDYLAPFRWAILAEHGAAIGVHGGLALVAVAAAIYMVARAGGLADLGRRVDLAERSARRGEGDHGLADSLRRDAEGEWE
ncbi:MAG: hypothetical protein OXT72_14750 [Gammaproteobacteria bacterium]|nr:hypothetical protein [Gammaproteobacteria bacterium]MDE0247229.1 hypothetical protein [Gammaproteobacteria bacterium]